MPNLTIRDAKIIFRNFSGKPTQFTPEGRKTFSVLIDDEQLAEKLKNDGWNVKALQKRDENDPQHYHLPVAVAYGNYPPRIAMVSGSDIVELDESSVKRLDWVDIEKVNVTINPSQYEIGGRRGVKAYLKTMVVYILEDELLSELEDKRQDIPF